MRPLPREWHNVHLSWCFTVKARSTGTPKRAMLPSCLHQNPKRRLKREGTGCTMRLELAALPRLQRIMALVWARSAR